MSAREAFSVDMSTSVFTVPCFSTLQRRREEDRSEVLITQHKGPSLMKNCLGFGLQEKKGKRKRGNPFPHINKRENACRRLARTEKKKKKKKKEEEEKDSS